MMLRASVSDIAGDDATDRSQLLAELVDATVGGAGASDEAADAARRSVAERLGPDWLVDACAVIANFEMMTRIADGTGARLRPEQLDAAADVIVEQRLDTFVSARVDEPSAQSS